MYNCELSISTEVHQWREKTRERGDQREKKAAVDEDKVEDGSVKIKNKENKKQMK